MKNKVLFLLIAFVIGIISVRAYSVEDFVHVVNNGAVTKEFIASEEKSGCKVTINATGNGASASIAYHFTCKEEKEEIINNQKEKVTNETYNLDGTISYSINGEFLVSSLDRTKEEDEADPFYGRIVSLTPYWGTEMSSKYAEISKYKKKNNKGDVLGTFKIIFDKCYLDEMGVCYSKTPGMAATNYLGKIKMDDSGANYALKHLKKEQRDLNNKSLMMKLAIFAVILVVVILVLKASTPDPTRKRCKY